MHQELQRQQGQPASSALDSITPLIVTDQKQESILNKDTAGIPYGHAKSKEDILRRKLAHIDSMDVSDEEKSRLKHNSMKKADELFNFFQQRTRTFQEQEDAIHPKTIPINESESNKEIEEK
jgi:hypothetical protein